MPDIWQVDNDIVNGLNDSPLGFYTLPEVFSIGENTYLISSNNDSEVFNGFRLNNGSWVSDPSIVSGMPSGVSNQSATVFNINGIDYCIIGSNNDSFIGRRWNISTWDNEPDIISGLPSGDSRYDKTPTAFYIDDQLYLIYTAFRYGVETQIRGFKWNGSTWIEDTSIVDGLSKTPNTSYRAAVFLYGAELKLIFGRWQPADGEGGAAWRGYTRENSIWVTDNDIISGLTTQSYILGGDTLIQGNYIYFIAGDWHGNLPNFYGFKALLAVTYTISGYVKSRSSIPFSGVLVTIGGNEDTTDDDGYYSIAGISSGSNDITVERSLKKTHSETRNITADETINFTLYEIKSGKIFKSTGSSLEGGIACGTGRREKK